MLDDLVERSVALPAGALAVLQPRDSSELPDDGPVEWAPIAPYWSVLWRSGVALATELGGEDLHGLRVVELGCGLALPSLAAARAGAVALATDRYPEPLELAERNARRNGVALETARVDWAAPGELLARTPFDVALASDLLYERGSADLLLSLLPRLAPRAWVADPGRAEAATFVERAAAEWEVETRTRGVVSLHALRRR